MKKIFFTLLTLGCLVLQTTAQTAFTEGNLVVCRIGNGTEPLAASGNTVYLDEYRYDEATKTATLVQSIPVSSGAEQLTMGGTLTYTGYLARSANNSTLTLAGFTGNVPTVAVVFANAKVDVSTKLPNLTGKNIPRAAMARGSDSLWVTTSIATGSSTKGGLYCIKRGASSYTEVTTTVDKKDYSSIKIYNGRIFAIQEYSTGIPSVVSRWGTNFQTAATSASNAISASSGAPNASDFTMAGEHASSAFKPLVCYIADTSSSKGIAKYSRGTSSSYPSNHKANISQSEGFSYYGITTYSYNADEKVVLYATRYNQNNSQYELVRITDVSGYNVVPDADDVTIEVVATAPAGTVFRGVAPAPVTIKEAQTIQNLSNITKTFGDDDFELTATASSGLEVTYTIADNTIATVTGKTVHILKAGETTITASQAGNNNFLPAEDLSVTLTVTREPIDYSWLQAPAIAVEENVARVAGPAEEVAKFTKFYVDGTEITLTDGEADLSGKTGTIDLKAASADGTEVIKLKISK